MNNWKWLAICVLTGFATSALSETLIQGVIAGIALVAVFWLMRGETEHE